MAKSVLLLSLVIYLYSRNHKITFAKPHTKICLDEMLSLALNHIKQVKRDLLERPKDSNGYFILGYHFCSPPPHPISSIIMSTRTDEPLNKAALECVALFTEGDLVTNISSGLAKLEWFAFSRPLEQAH